MRRADSLTLLLLVVLVTTGCASSRVYDVTGQRFEIEEAAEVYIVVAELTEKVTYNLLGNPFNYAKRAPGSEMIEARPDVPDQVAKYLSALSYAVVLGPKDALDSRADYMITYKELWGWDLRPIIKMLEIEICETSSARCSSVSFEEMTFFNSQPTAKSVVPRMLDELLQTDSAHP